VAPLLAFLLVSSVSLPQALNLYYGLQRITFLLVLFMLYVTVAYCPGAGRQNLFIRYLVLTLLVVSGLSIFGCALGSFLPVATPIGMLMRMFGNTNYGAAYLLTVTPLSLALYLSASRRLEKALYGTTLFLSLTVVTFSMVRGAWVSILIGLWVVSWAYFDRKRQPGSVWSAPPQSQIGALLFIGAAILSAVTLRPVCLPESHSFAERIASTFDLGSDSLQIRMAFWRGTVQLIRDHLWTGVGIGNFALAFVPYRTPIVYRHPTVQAEHPHNEYLNVWAELGPLGTLASAWLLIRVVRLGWGLLGRSGARREVLAGILGGLAATAAYASLFYVVHTPAAAMNVAILLGLLDAMDREVKGQAQGSPVRLRVLVPSLVVMGFVWFQYFLAPVASEIHYFLALRDFRASQIERGLRRLNQSLAWNPESYVTRYRLATALFSQERYLEAIDEAHKALQVHPNLEIAYWVIGSSYVKLGEKPKAKTMFLKALDISPHYPHALTNLGVRALEEGRLAEAETLFLRAAEGLGRTDVSPYLNLGKLYEAVSRLGAALQMYETAVTIEPNSGSLWFQVARLRALTGDRNGAHAALSRAIELDRALGARAAKDPAFAALR
jgi:tetratricopeptide (TPR) repeat protein